MPTYDEIIQKHADNARAEIETEAAKDANTREAENLAREINGLVAQIAPMQKQPTKYKYELRELNKQLVQKQERLDALKDTPRPYDPQLSGGGSLHIVR